MAQLWDYLFIESIWNEGNLLVAKVNGKVIGTEQQGLFKNKIIHPPLHEYLNAIGEDGWEIVAMSLDQHALPASPALVAKRPR